MMVLGAKGMINNKYSIWGLMPGYLGAWTLLVGILTDGSLRLSESRQESRLQLTWRLMDLRNWSYKPSYKYTSLIRATNLQVWFHTGQPSEIL